MEGKDDLHSNFVLKFDNKQSIALLDYIDFSNFNPYQISCINFNDENRDLLIKILNKGAKPQSLFISGFDKVDIIPKEQS